MGLCFWPERQFLGTGETARYKSVRPTGRLVDVALMLGKSAPP